MVAGSVHPCCRSSDSCDKRAHEHSRHEDMALDGSLYRVVWHGTPVSSHLDIFLLFILLDILDLDIW